MPPSRTGSLQRRRAPIRLATAVLAAASALGAAAGAPVPVPPPAAAPVVVAPSTVAAFVADPDTGDGRVVLPVEAPVVRFFVRPAERWSPGHRGVDLAAEPGTPVRTPVSGVVAFAGPVAGRTVVTVLRADGLRSSLEPVADVAEVGTPVVAGDVIGVVAASPAGGAGSGSAAGHCGPTSCLHWGVRRDGEYVDPLGLLEPVTVVLLPWR